jgi:chemotaxis protein MotB
MPELDPSLPVRNSDDEESGGAPAWIITFADMMSLLLCFFVLLLSFSTMDLEKFKAVAESMREAFQFTAAPVPGPATEVAAPRPQIIQTERSPVLLDPEAYQQHLQSAKHEIDLYIDDQGLSEYIETKIEGEHLKVVNSNPLNFPAGEAKLLESSLKYLDMLSTVLQKFDFQIIVEGHTDDRPINTAEFRSNWELSAARAASFVLYLESRGVDPQRLAVHGYGPHRPIASNNSEESRARNRRIEVLLKEPQPGTRAELMPDELPGS